MDEFRHEVASLNKPVRAAIDSLVAQAATLADGNHEGARAVAVTILMSVSSGPTENANAALLLVDATLRSPATPETLRDALLQLLPTCFAELAADPTGPRRAVLSQAKTLVKAWKKAVAAPALAVLNASLSGAPSTRTADADAPTAAENREQQMPKQTEAPSAATVEGRSALLRLLAGGIRRLPPAKAEEYRRALAAHPGLQNRSDPAVYAFLAAIADEVAKALVAIAAGGANQAAPAGAAVDGGLDGAVERLARATDAATGVVTRQRFHPPPYVPLLKCDRSGSLAAKPGGELPPSRGLGHPAPKQPLQNPFVLREGASRDKGGAVRPLFMPPNKWEKVRRFKLEAPAALSREDALAAGPNQLSSGGLGVGEKRPRFV